MDTHRRVNEIEKDLSLSKLETYEEAMITDFLSYLGRIY